MTERYYNGEDHYRSRTNRTHHRDTTSGQFQSADRQQQNNHVARDLRHRDQPSSYTSSDRRDLPSDRYLHRYRRQHGENSLQNSGSRQRLDSRELRYSRVDRHPRSRHSPHRQRSSSSRSRDRSSVRDFPSGSKDSFEFRYAKRNAIYRRDYHNRRPASTTSSSSPGRNRSPTNHHRHSSCSQEFRNESRVSSVNVGREDSVTPKDSELMDHRSPSRSTKVQSPGFHSRRDSSSESTPSPDQVNVGARDYNLAETSQLSSGSFRNRFASPHGSTSKDPTTKTQNSLLNVQSRETHSSDPIETCSPATTKKLVLSCNGEIIGGRPGVGSNIGSSAVESKKIHSISRHEVGKKQAANNQPGSAETLSRKSGASSEDTTEVTTEAVISPVKESQAARANTAADAKVLNLGGSSANLLPSLADTFQQNKSAENGKKTCSSTRTVTAVRRTSLAVVGIKGTKELISPSHCESLENNEASTTAAPSIPIYERGTRAAVEERSCSTSPVTRSPTPTTITSDSGIDTFSCRDSSARETPSTTTSLCEQERNESTPTDGAATTPASIEAGDRPIDRPPQIASQTRTAKRALPHLEKSESAAAGTRTIMRCDGPDPLASTSELTKTGETKNSPTPQPAKSSPDEARRSVLLDYQNSSANFFRTCDKFGVLAGQASTATKLLEPQSLSNVGDLSFSDGPGMRLRGPPRLPSSNSDSLERSKEFDVSWENYSMSSLELVPMKKLSATDLVEIDTMMRKRRRVEVLVPDYKNQEPKRFTGMFHMKLVAEFQKQMANINKTEKKKIIPPFGKISQSDVINQIRNSTDMSDPLLRQVALYAVTNHRKQENFLHIILVLIANGFDCNVKNDNGDALLKLALLTEDLTLIDVLLKHTQLEKLDNDGNSALHLAAQIWAASTTTTTSWDIVDLILSMEHKSASLMFARNKESKAALVSYLHCPEFSAAKMEDFLIGFTPEQIEQHPESLLHLLAQARRLDLVVFCLSRYHFEPNRLDSDSRTFMHVFAQSATLSKADADTLTELARSLRASVIIPDKKGKTALQMAIGSGHVELVRLWKLLPVDEMVDKEKGCIIRDIAFGKEAFPIRVVNEKSDRRMTDFVYIKQNIYLGDAPRLKGSVACSCRMGQCSTTTCPCLKRGLGYSATGTIVPGTCKGNPIFECGVQCACGPNCGSRVVQRGLKYPLEIFMTAKRGWGVRTSRTIQPGEFIVEFVGEVVESDRLLARDPNNDWAMELTVDNYDGTMFHVDPTTCGNVARFLNHSCDPNLFPVRIYQSGESVDTGVVMAMFSAQVIQKSHELTFHYGDAYWERQIEREIYCNCGTSKCKFAPPKTGRKRTRT